MLVSLLVYRVAIAMSEQLEFVFEQMSALDQY